MLVGHYFQRVGDKGRVALPVRFRRGLGQEVILARWYDGSLAIFSPKAWQTTIERLTSGSLTAPARDTERFLLGGAYEMRLDGQGRFVIPRPLRAYSDLGGEAVFVGLGRRVEVWSRSRWEECEKRIVGKAEELVEQVQVGKALGTG